MKKLLYILYFLTTVSYCSDIDKLNQDCLRELAMIDCVVICQLYEDSFYTTNLDYSNVFPYLIKKYSIKERTVIEAINKEIKNNDQYCELDDWCAMETFGGIAFLNKNGEILFLSWFICDSYKLVISKTYTINDGKIYFRAKNGPYLTIQNKQIFNILAPFIKQGAPHTFKRLVSWYPEYKNIPAAQPVKDNQTPLPKQGK